MNSSLAHKPSYWLEWHEFPDEYERVWSELAALAENGGDRLCQCLESGETWQYMGTQLEADGWKHCFRHRHHPVSRKLEYRRISSQLGFLDGGER
jgi:hypothetical protein